MTRCEAFVVLLANEIRIADFGASATPEYRDQLIRKSLDARKSFHSARENLEHMDEAGDTLAHLMEVKDKKAQEKLRRVGRRSAERTLALFDEILESSQAIRNLDEVNERFSRRGSKTVAKTLETAAIWAEASFRIAEAMEGAASTVGESVEGSISEVLGVGAETTLFSGKPFAAYFAAGLATAAATAKVASELAKKEVGEEIDKEFEKEVGHKFEELGQKLDKLGNLEGKLDKLAGKADKAEGKLEKLEPKLDILGPKIDKLEPKLDKIQTNQGRTKEFWQFSLETWSVKRAKRAGVRLQGSSSLTSPTSQAFSVGSIHLPAPGFMVIKIIVDGVSTDVSGRNIFTPSNVLVEAGISLIGASHSVQIEFGDDYTGPIEFSGEKPQGLDMCTVVEGDDSSESSPNPCK